MSGEHPKSFHKPFWIRCVDIAGHDFYTEGEEYLVYNGDFIDDEMDKITFITKSELEDLKGDIDKAMEYFLENYTTAKWELVQGNSEFEIISIEELDDLIF